MEKLTYLVAQFTIPSNQVNVPQITAGNLVEAILQGTFFIVGIIAVIMIIIGGYQYTTSNGDPAGAARARKTIIYAIVGMVISLFAFVIMQFIRGVF
ncbi:MAG TPA: hypothetical protein VD907_05835 [Verrucomicrobiae bacterium]|nr:hypothetical protein [Verrucomicrobiae bacterium]